jgi:AcrR family transcriptional regulator
VLVCSLNGGSMNTGTKKNLRQIQAEERRLQIIHTALKVFAANGFKGASIKDIAAAAGISQGLMYHYFPSKEALLEATVQHHSFLPQMKQILTGAEERPVQEVFNDLSIGFLNLLESKSELLDIFFQELRSNAQVKKTWSNMVFEGVSLLQKYIDSQVAAGRLRTHKTAVTARSVLGIIFIYYLTQDVFRSNRMKKEEFIKEALNTILRGIAAR